MAKSESKPPKPYQTFIKRYPKIGEAWQNVRSEEEAGPLAERTARLVTLGIAIGSMREGAVHSATRKAMEAGASRADIEHVVALAAGTIGFPAAVAVSTWVQDQFAKRK